MTLKLGHQPCARVGNGPPVFTRTPPVFLIVARITCSPLVSVPGDGHEMIGLDQSCWDCSAISSRSTSPCAAAFASGSGDRAGRQTWIMCLAGREASITPPPVPEHADVRLEPARCAVVDGDDAIEP